MSWCRWKAGQYITQGSLLPSPAFAAENDPAAIPLPLSDPFGRFWRDTKADSPQPYYLGGIGWDTACGTGSPEGPGLWPAANPLPGLCCQPVPLLLGGFCPELSPEVPALALLQGALPACLPREVLDPKSASSELDSGLICSGYE